MPATCRMARNKGARTNDRYGLKLNALQTWGTAGSEESYGREVGTVQTYELEGMEYHKNKCLGIFVVSVRFVGLRSTASATTLGPAALSRVSD